MDDKEKAYIEERIKYAEERIAFWKGNSIEQVWIGIKQELETLKRKLY